MPVWHASVAHQSPRGVVGVCELRHKRIREGVGVGRELLQGVGVGSHVSFTTDPPGHAIHVQKPLSEAEILLLPKGWMEIPAVDELGPCRVIKE